MTNKKYYEVTIQNDRIIVKYFKATEKDMIYHIGRYYKGRVKEWNEILEEGILLRAKFYQIQIGKKMVITEVGD